MANVKLTYLEGVKLKKKPQTYEEALKFIDILEVEIKDIQDQIDTAVDLGENYHGYTQDEEEYHEWLKKARLAIAIKRRQIKLLKSLANNWKQEFAAKLKKKNKNLVIKVDQLETKNARLKKDNKKLRNSLRQIFEEIITAPEDDELARNIYNILVEENLIPSNAKGIGS